MATPSQVRVGLTVPVHSAGLCQKETRGPGTRGSTVVRACALGLPPSSASFASSFCPLDLPLLFPLTPASPSSPCTFSEFHLASPPHAPGGFSLALLSLSLSLSLPSLAVSVSFSQSVSVSLALPLSLSCHHCLCFSRCLFLALSCHHFVCFSHCLSLAVSRFLSHCLSLSGYLSFTISLSLYLCHSFSLSVSLLLSLSLSLAVSLFLSLSRYLCFSQCLCLSRCLFLHLSPSLSPSLSLTHTLYFSHPPLHGAFLFPFHPHLHSLFPDLLGILFSLFPLRFLPHPTSSLPSPLVLQVLPSSASPCPLLPFQFLCQSLSLTLPYPRLCSHRLV
nr:uncharacterized protein LOC129528788 [Gorilla gorilla gorilla]